jgi:hypothetical protein
MTTLTLRALIASAAFVFLGGAAQAQALEIEGVKLEPSALVGSSTLPLNGAGVRTRAIFKVYVAGLYVPQKASDPARLLAQSGARRVSLTMLRNVDAETFFEALNEGLKNNHTGEQFTAMAPNVATLNANLKSFGDAKKGDVIHFDYLPDSGTRVTVNGKVQGAPIPGEDFYKAVLRIWIGEKPVDSGLKKGLLGSHP